MSADAEPVTTRCGHVALIGAPNSGKSTLLNRLVGSKLAIVTPKVQTTRARMLGIVVDGNAQIIFVDTPGIFEPRRRLERAMVKAAWTGAQESEIIVVLVDAARGLDADTSRIVDGLRAAKRRAVLALNKVDKVKRGDLLPLAQALDQEKVFDRVFMISGLTGDGVEDLKLYLANALPRGPWLYPEDEITDVPLRLLAAEATREQIFRQLHQELPYSATVETEKWEERPDGSVRIDQIVHVAREGQKAIVLGQGGRQIKSIGAAARADLEATFQRRVHLFLQVRVTENWTEDRERYAAMRLDFDE
ncbi:MAG: GTPase Era [Alphaproteobacteria bacterium]|nr:GTPase Era [Alphaproteobacteria bacterium]MDE2513990.1 GTPase Era [Alphaproteobacteria bacterium]